MKSLVQMLPLTLAASIVFAQPPAALVQGLQLPYKMILTPGRNLLVAEGGTGANQGRISLVTQAGTRQSVLEGLPAGVNNESKLPIGPTGLALRGRTLFIAISDGDSDAGGPTPGTTILNPKGMSSQLFSSILRADFSAELDRITAPFRLTLASQQQLADGNDVALNNGAGDSATIRVLVDFPDVRPFAPTIYKHSDPYALLLDPNDSNKLYLIDAGQDTVVRVDTETGRYRVISHLPRVPAPPPFGQTDSVPTSAFWYADRLLVTQLTGFPFIKGASGAVLVNVQDGTVEPFMTGLTNVMDVISIDRGSQRARFLVLEFSGDLAAPMPAPAGRLLLFDEPVPSTLMPTNAATSMVYDAESRDLFVSDLFGNISRLKLP